MTVTVEGAARLRRTLRQAGVSLDDLKAAHAQAAGVVAAAASSRAPRLSGRLASSVRPGATRRAALVRAGKSRVPYAGVIHWGWPRRNIRPNPFIAAAAQDTESRWQNAYADAVQTIIDAVEGA